MAVHLRLELLRFRVSVHLIVLDQMAPLSAHTSNK